MIENGFAPVIRVFPSPVGRMQGPNATAPLVQRHYSAFNPTTNCSAPVPRIGVFPLAGVARLAVSLCIATTGSPVPRESLFRGHAAFEPDAAWAGLQDSAHTLPRVTTTPGSDINHTLSAVHRRFAFARLLGPHLTGSSSRLFPRRSPPLLLTTAARGGLRSTPDRRPRGALPHLSRSYAPPFVGAQDTRWPAYLGIRLACKTA